MKKILLVDDSKEFQSLFQGILEDEGYLLTLASSGREALKILHGDKFDLVISDVEMMDGSGLWLLQEARKLPIFPKIVVTTGNPKIEESEVLHLGARAFFQKPFPLNLFLDWIGRELE